MRTMFVIITATFLWIACAQPVENAPDDRISIKTVDALTLSNPQVAQIIKKYLRADTTNNAAVAYKLLIEESDFETNLSITTVNDYATLMKHSLPIGYFVMDGKIVVVKCRLRSVFQSSPIFLERLDEVLRTTMSPHFFDSLTSTYDSPVWKIKIVGDSVSVDQTAIAPEIQVKKIIEFIPPGKKSD